MADSALRVGSGKTRLWVVIVVVSLAPLLAGSSSVSNSDDSFETLHRSSEEGQNTGNEDGSNEEDDDVERRATNFVSVHGEIGQGWSVGVGYSRASEVFGRHGATWLAIGPNAHLTRRADSDYGVISLLTGRFGTTGHGAGFGLEVSAGAGGTSFDSLAVIRGGGLFYSLRKIEFGYSYRYRALLGQGRPDWLGGHFLGVRGYIPLNMSN